MSKRRGGRKTRSERLEILKNDLKKKLEDKDKLNEEIKEISAQIAEIEQYFLLQEAAKLKETLGKKGMSIDDVTKAIESGLLNLPNDNQG
jgi:hypothetical protein